MFVQVVLRYVFAQSFLWGEELSLFAFIWCVYLGAAICFWRRTHFAFDLFAEVLQRPRRRRAAPRRRPVRAARDGGDGEGRLALLAAEPQRLSPALGITLLVPTIVIPVSGALMSLVACGHRRDCRQIWTGEAPARRRARSSPLIAPHADASAALLLAR